MSMQTVRRKALRQNPYSTLGKPPLRSSVTVSRVPLMAPGRSGAAG
ncbi:hypothetical protein PSJ60_24035 [Escherichia coli]|nr:hypothetical protein [Escherichia coli]MDC9067853.1 hypothetical protein [Escherichia coli]